MIPPRERIALCAVVRDEEQLLPGCLESVRGAVDELVLLDTGSRDRTVEIARASGARVLHRPWDDDFADARNAALAAVQAGWVLVLDADERLAPGAGPLLRGALASGSFDLGELELHEADELDADPASVARGLKRRGEPRLVARLLRRTPELRFRGIVLEEAGPGRHGRVEASIVHYGGVPELASARARTRLRMELLERRCQLDPGDARARSHLARELLLAGDEARGRAEAERAWRTLLELPHADRKADDFVLAATLHAGAALARGELDEAAAVLAEAQSFGEPHPSLDLLAATLLETVALEASSSDVQDEALASARAACERCLAQAGRTFASQPLPGAATWAARTRLATLDLLCGHTAVALAGFERALSEQPSVLEARLGCIEARIELGSAAEALEELEGLLAGGSPDAWTLAAAAAAALSSSSDAALFAERALDASAGRQWLGPHRRLRLEALTEQLDRIPTRSAI